MLEQLFTWLSDAISGTFELAIVAAFGWGIMSIVLSPCHLSSIPLIVGYISGQSKDDMKHPYRMSFVFGVGIMITIGLIGAITASLGRMMGDVGVWGNLIVAAVFFVVGLHLMDVVSLNWNTTLPQTSLARGWKGALLLGLLFGVGLGPCTFAYMAPVLGVVFSVASSSLFRAGVLLAAFALGHCSLLVLAGGAVGTVQRYLNWTEKSRSTIYLKRSAGALVLLAGIYVVASAF